MREMGHFDGDMEQFVEQLPPVTERIDWLLYLRFLVEHRGLEHEVAGEPSGEIAEMLDSRFRTPYSSPDASTYSERLKEHIAETGDM